MSGLPRADMAGLARPDPAGLLRPRGGAGLLRLALPATAPSPLKCSGKDSTSRRAGFAGPQRPPIFRKANLRAMLRGRATHALLTRSRLGLRVPNPAVVMSASAGPSRFPSARDSNDTHRLAWQHSRSPATGSGRRAAASSATPAYRAPSAGRLLLALGPYRRQTQSVASR